MQVVCFGTFAAERPPIVGIAHVALRVANLAKAEGFYSGVLGFDAPFRLYAENGESRLVYFKINDRQYVELMPGLSAGEDDRLGHIAFETTNLSALRNYLAEQGVRVPAQTTKGDDGNVSMMVVDPDGHQIEFVQYLPDSLYLKARGSYLTKERIADRLIHVGAIVSDVAAADHFYKQILGFSEIWRGGTTDNSTDWINMKVPDGTDYLEYMVINRKLDRRQLGVLHHLALQVSDIQKALETVRERFHDGDSNSVQSPQVGRSNRWQLNLYDPDGTRTEVMEPFTAR